MKNRKTILCEHSVIAADIYDCFSLRAAQRVGYEAAYLSADGIAECICGLSDASQMSGEEMLWIAKRIISFAEIPIIADIKNGFGISAESAGRIAGRLAKAGVDAVWLDDTQFQNHGVVVAKEEWASRVRAVHEAVREYSCRLICTTDVEPEDMAEATVRCHIALSGGADMVGMNRLETMAEAKVFSHNVKGLKIWSGVDSGSINAKELEASGYSLILSCHSVNGALEGMRSFGERTRKDLNTVYHDQHDYDGMLPSRSYYDLFDFYKIWIPLEQHFYKSGRE